MTEDIEKDAPYDFKNLPKNLKIDDYSLYTDRGPEPIISSIEKSRMFHMMIENTVTLKDNGYFERSVPFERFMFAPAREEMQRAIFKCAGVFWDSHFEAFEHQLADTIN